jgi:hypothetical protein
MCNKRLAHYLIISDDYIRLHAKPHRAYATAFVGGLVDCARWILFVDHQRIAEQR